jgi:hypothetical protein
VLDKNIYVFGKLFRGKILFRKKNLYWGKSYIEEKIEGETVIGPN